MKAGNAVIRIHYTTLDNINQCDKSGIVVLKINVTRQRKSFHVKGLKHMKKQCIHHTSLINVHLLH